MRICAAFARPAQIKLGCLLLPPHVCAGQMFVVGRLDLPVSHLPHLHLLLDLRRINNNMYMEKPDMHTPCDAFTYCVLILVIVPYNKKRCVLFNALTLILSDNMHNQCLSPDITWNSMNSILRDSKNEKETPIVWQWAAILLSWRRTAEPGETGWHSCRTLSKQLLLSYAVACWEMRACQTQPHRSTIRLPACTKLFPKVFSFYIRCLTVHSTVLGKLKNEVGFDESLCK